jgi:hypothetical protein
MSCELPRVHQKINLDRQFILSFVAMQHHVDAAFDAVFDDVHPQVVVDPDESSHGLHDIILVHVDFLPSRAEGCRVCADPG